MRDIREKFTENAEQFDALMTEMLEENKRLKLNKDIVIAWCNKNIEDQTQVTTFAVQVRDCLENI